MTKISVWKCGHSILVQSNERYSVSLVFWFTILFTYCLDVNSSWCRWNQYDKLRLYRIQCSFRSSAKTFGDRKWKIGKCLPFALALRATLFEYRLQLSAANLFPYFRPVSVPPFSLFSFFCYLLNLLQYSCCQSILRNEKPSSFVAWSMMYLSQ